MRYRTVPPTAGVAVGAGTPTPIHSIVPTAGRLIGIEKVSLGTNSRDLAHEYMACRWIEYDADGSTGTTNAAVAIDPRVTAAVPSGKHSWSGTGTQLPNGNPREMWRGKVHPTTEGELDFASLVDGGVLPITPGKIAVLEVTPVEAQTVKVTEIITRDL